MKRYLPHRGLCVWPVSENAHTHYCEVTNQNGINVREAQDSPTFNTKAQAIADATRWINRRLDADQTAGRNWLPPPSAATPEDDIAQPNLFDTAQEDIER